MNRLSDVFLPGEDASKMTVQEQRVIELLRSGELKVIGDADKPSGEPEQAKKKRKQEPAGIALA